jgi:hypothetical protein
MNCRKLWRSPRKAMFSNYHWHSFFVTAQLRPACISALPRCMSGPCGRLFFKKLHPVSAKRSIVCHTHRSSSSSNRSWTTFQRKVWQQKTSSYFDLQGKQERITIDAVISQVRLCGYKSQYEIEMPRNKGRWRVVRLILPIRGSLPGNSAW